MFHHIRILAGCDSAASCPVGCALVFPEFNEICYDHIFEHPELNPQDFESFEQECLSQDALALVQYALELQAQGCIIDLVGSSGSGGGRDPCASGPCLNGGSRSDAEGTYECACPSMWMGKQCQMTNPFGDATEGRRALQEDTFLSQWLGLIVLSTIQLIYLIVNRTVTLSACN